MLSETYYAQNYTGTIGLGLAAVLLKVTYIMLKKKDCCQ